MSKSQQSSREPHQPRTRPVAPTTAAIREEIEKLLNLPYDGRKVGDITCGVYVFYDYDGEPIYVGQTWEKLRTRVRRHLTNQRTDAVAMNVLDPFEVAEVELWPLVEISEELRRAKGKRKSELLGSRVKSTLLRAEYTAYEQVLGRSELKAILNEKEIPPVEKLKLPKSVRERIIPPAIFEERSHPDVRIARRASTIASLARVISERKVSKGLRNTLQKQARRLLWLAERRFNEIGGGLPVSKAGEPH